MMDERYRLFRICARTCHFTRAAEEALRTQSAVSQSMALLEEELGTLLFHREGRKLRLTGAGALLLRYCDEAAEQERSLSAEMDNLRSLVSGTVTIAAGTTAAACWLPRPLAAFRRQYPGIRVHLLTGPSTQVLAWLAEGACDVGLATLPASHPRVRLKPLLAREDVIVCAPGSAHLPRPATLASLDRAPFILPDASTRTRAFLDELFRAGHVVPDVVLEIRGWDVVKRYVREDFGVSIVPRMAVEDELARGELEGWPLAGESRVLALALPTRALGRAAQAMVTALESAASTTK